jgi:hypothetical protein
MSNRPDLSNYVAHFTTDRAPVASADKGNPTRVFASLNARDRLESILDGKKIVASQLPWKAGIAVSFTECPWSSLVGHSKAYSAFGVAFAKSTVFAAGGGPAYYVRPDHFQKQVWDPAVAAFVTPFWPPYRPSHLKGPAHLGGKTVDYSHEREWRVPGDFSFELNQVEFVILKSYEDMAQFPKPLKDAIGREKFLLMDIYESIERLWPVHNL